MTVVLHREPHISLLLHSHLLKAFLIGPSPDEKSRPQDTMHDRNYQLSVPFCSELGKNQRFDPTEPEERQKTSRILPEGTRQERPSGSKPIKKYVPEVKEEHRHKSRFLF